MELKLDVDVAELCTLTREAQEEIQDAQRALQAEADERERLRLEAEKIRAANALRPLAATMRNAAASGLRRVKVMAIDWKKDVEGRHRGWLMNEDFVRVLRDGSAAHLVAQVLLDKKLDVYCHFSHEDPVELEVAWEEPAAK